MWKQGEVRTSVFLLVSLYLVRLVSLSAFPQLSAKDFSEEVFWQFLHDFHLARPLVFAQMLVAVRFQRRQMKSGAWSCDDQGLDQFAALRIWCANHSRFGDVMMPQKNFLDFSRKHQEA
jgi:hypothetical protein